MAEIKGLLLNAWFEFLKEHHEEATLSKAIAELDAVERARLQNKLLDGSWYPLTTLEALARITGQLAKANDPNSSPVQIGRYIAHYSFTGPYRSLLGKTPSKQVQKYARIGEFFFRDARKLETEMTSATSCLARYFYEPGFQPTRGLCQVLIGFWSHTLEMAGASRTVAEHTACVLEGARCCEFSFEWQVTAEP